MVWLNKELHFFLIKVLNIKPPDEKIHSFGMTLDIFFYYFLVCTTQYITDTKQIKTLTGKIIKGTIQTHLFTALVWAFIADV